VPKKFGGVFKNKSKLLSPTQNFFGDQKKNIFFCQLFLVDIFKNFINILNYIKKARFKLFLRLFILSNVFIP